MEKLIIGGLYRHFKGDLCKVLGVVQNSESLEELVRYIDLKNGSEWVRPKLMFLGKIKTEKGIIERRFTLIKKKTLVVP